MTIIPRVGDILHRDSVSSSDVMVAEPEIYDDVVYPEDYHTDEVDTQTWLDTLLEDCMRLGASDLLMTTEAGGRILTARARVDGQMRPMRRVQGPESGVIIGKFKSANKIASGGSFLPEEAVHMVKVAPGVMRKGRVVRFGKADGCDAIVIRLPQKGEPKSLEDLGFGEQTLEQVQTMLSGSNKMVLIAGPMGVGKTNTAQGALLYRSRGTRTVWSLEDPVERELPGVVQLEVDEKNGAGFDVLLPSLLRADYDTLFLGEIRDPMTAAAGIRQAKAGRQVITTIHANDNITALLRLIELARDSPLSVMDSVRGVISQRLVGRLNPDWDGVSAHDKYRGRIPINEVLDVTDELIEAVMNNAPLSEMKRIATQNSGSSFAADAQRLVDAGITDNEEIRRVLGD